MATMSPKVNSTGIVSPAETFREEPLKGNYRGKAMHLLDLRKPPTRLQDSFFGSRRSIEFIPFCSGPETGKPNGKRNLSRKVESFGSLFEDALSQLEDVVGDLEQGNLALDQTLSTYEQGVRLLKVCHQHLGKAEQKVQILVAQNEDGDELEEFDNESTASASDSASPRRSSTKTAPAKKKKVEVAEFFRRPIRRRRFKQRFKSEGDQTV